MIRTLKYILNTIVLMVFLMFSYLIYLLASTWQYWYLVTSVYHRLNGKLFNEIENIINENISNSSDEYLYTLLRGNYSWFEYKMTGAWWDLEIKRKFKELWWNSKVIIVTYDLWTKSFSYNNSYHVSKKISWNRWYKSDVNWDPSDDF